MIPALRFSPALSCIIGMSIGLSMAVDSAAGQITWYVNDSGDVSAGCTSWADACPELQTALTLTTAGDSIWIAAGTYRPDYDTEVGQHLLERSASFQLQDGVAIHGGFGGSESTLQERAGLYDQTILSGDLLGNDGPEASGTEENSYHVIATFDVSPSAILDGVTITGGNANGPFPYDFGGGTLVTGASPTFVRCRWVGNHADHGGAVRIEFGSPSFLECLFLNNTALHWGGALDNMLAGPTLINSVFDGNTTAGDGGAVHSDQVLDPQLINCTITRNTANRGGGLFNYAAALVELTNSIVWSNSDSTGTGEAAQLYVNAPENDFIVNFSCVQGWTGVFGGEGNTADDPQLVDLTTGNLRPEPDSPCVDSGSDEALPRAITTDLDGNPRFVDGNDDGMVTVDMGAYELQLLVMCSADVTGDGMVGPADLAQLLGTWGTCAGCITDLDGDGIVGASDLALLLGAWGSCTVRDLG